MSVSTSTASNSPNPPPPFFSFLPPPYHHRLSQSERQKKADSIQDIAANLYSRNRVQELERAKAEVEKKHEEMKAHYEAELHNLRKKYDGDVAQLKASRDERVQAAVKKLFEEVSVFVVISSFGSLEVRIPYM